MPRRREVPKRETIPDPKFGSTLAAKFINSLMRDGKKSTAEKIFYQAMDIDRGADGPVRLDRVQAGDHEREAHPRGEVAARGWRHVPGAGGSSSRASTGSRLPVDQELLGGTFSEKSFPEKLGAELAAAAKNEGASIRKKDETHRMAEANKAFSHYRW